MSDGETYFSEEDNVKIRYKENSKQKKIIEFDIIKFCCEMTKKEQYDYLRMYWIPKLQLIEKDKEIKELKKKYGVLK